MTIKATTPETLATTSQSSPERVGNTQTDLPQEAAELLGTENLQLISNQLNTIEQLVELAATPNPFRTEEDFSGEKIKKLDPEQIELIKHYDESRWRKTQLEPLSGLRLHFFTARLAKRGIALMKELEEAHRQDTSEMNHVSTEIGSILHDDPSQSLDPPTLVSIFDVLDQAAGRLTPQSAYRFLGNMSLAISYGYRYKATAFTKRHPQLKNRPANFASSNNVAERFREAQIEFKDLAAENRGLRKAGTSLYRATKMAVEGTQLREAAYLLHYINLAKERMPNFDSLGEDKLRTVALIAEKYLAECTERAVEIIRQIDPGLLNNPELHREIKKLGNLSLANALQQEELEESGLPPSVITGVAFREVKDTIRGGRRLKPNKNEDRKEIQEQADSLHALRDDQGRKILEPAESGVIMSATLGRLVSFLEALESLQSIKSNRTQLSVEQKALVAEGANLDVDAVFEKIAILLKEPSTHTQLTRILGVENVKKLKKTLESKIQIKESEA